MKLPKFKAFGLACAVLGCAFSTVRADIIEVTQDISTDTRWTRDNVYVLPKVIYVLPPARLTIEPGTLIRGASPATTGFTNSPGTLAICRGAKIISNGTVDDPVIFTTVDDTLVPGGENTRPATIPGSGGPVANPNGNYSTTGPQGLNNNAFAHGRECGGLVLLGRTPIAYDGNGDAARPRYVNGIFSGEALALPTGAPSPEAIAGTSNEAGNGVGFAVLEGLSVDPVTLGTPLDPDGTYSFDADGAGPNAPAPNTGITPTTTFQRGVYGGIDEGDSSGVVRFLQLRYGGFLVSTGIEINGLTMGAVGRGTVVEWVEVSNNADDCFEWFGGYVNCRYLFGIHCGDDGIDWDQGFSGTIQQAFIHEGGSNFGRVGFPGVATETTAGKDVSQFGPERCFELDGPEPNNSGILPRSNGWVFNVTCIGNKGGSNVDSNDDAIRVRRSSSGQIAACVFEDINNGIIEQSDNVNPVVAGVENDTDLLNSYYFNNGGTAIGSLVGTTILTTGTEATTVAQLKAKGQLNYHGLDPTLVDKAGDAGDASIVARNLTRTIPARDGAEDFLSPVRHTGAMRDNNWLFGWSWTATADLLVTSNMIRPHLTLAIEANKPVITFNADTTATGPGDAAVYIVERSTNGAKWVPVGAVSDGSAADGTNRVLADTTAASGTITVTDSAYDYTGAPVSYRVIAQ